MVRRPRLGRLGRLAIGVLLWPAAKTVRGGDAALARGAVLSFVGNLFVTIRFAFVVAWATVGVVRWELQHGDHAR